MEPVIKKWPQISKEDQKFIIGGNEHSCLVIGSPCLSDIDCCSGKCIPVNSSMEKVCAPPEN